MSTLALVKPDELYNLGAQSHVGISFAMPEFTAQTNAIGVLNLLHAIKSLELDCRFYQASSSEMFGTHCDDDGLQRETSRMLPSSPYGCAKLYAFHMVRCYRDSYGMHLNNGILFNHESPRRGTNFVTNKIVKTAVQIKLGYKSKIELGNLDVKRDWGHSKDYVRAMQLILAQEKPDDWVVSTGEAYSVRDFLEIVFSKLELNYQDHLVFNPKFIRPKEVPFLKGDSSRIRNELGWSPEYTFDSMIDEMVDYWLRKLNSDKDYR
jgi:GDPmannose 4,6-dehydratase